MKNSKRFLFGFMHILIVFLIIILIPDITYARPGGGSHFSGGRGTFPIHVLILLHTHMVHTEDRVMSYLG